jgi:hypothetical protein
MQLADFVGRAGLSNFGQFDSSRTRVGVHDLCALANNLNCFGRCNRGVFDGCLSEISKGQFLTVAVFDDLGHPIAATHIDGGD